MTHTHTQLHRHAFPLASGSALTPLAHSGLSAARLGASEVMLTDANKSTLDLLALNLCDERRQGRWAEGAKVDLAEWDWRKPPPRCATMVPLDDSR